MKDFQEYVLSLPKPLPGDEQERLFREYFNTKDEKIKNLLIEHNLRLCLKVAYDFYKHTKDYITIEELYSQCCEYLIRAIDLYNPDNEIHASFANYAITHIENKLIRDVNQDKLRRLYLKNTVLNLSDEEIDYFDVIGSDSGDKIVSDLEAKELVDTILRYINNIEERWREPFKMHLGLRGEKTLTNTQIAKSLGLTRQRVEAKFKELTKGLKTYLLKRDSTLAWRDKEQDPNEINEMLFNGYFGVNGEKLHTVKQIKQQFGVSDSAHKAKSIATKLVESGEYTQDEIEEIINSRREKSKQNYLELYSNWYNSYYGLNGYSRKSVSMLAYEFDYSISGIMAGIKRYKNYLQSLSEKEQEENQPI